MKYASRHLSIIAALFAAAVVSGCTPGVPGSPQPPPGQPPLADTSWVLESYGEPANPSAVLPGTEITVHFDGHTEVTGVAGCNSYGGTYASQLDGSLEIGDITQTEMFCVEPGVMDQEALYLDLLRDAGRYEYVNDRLQISSGSRMLIFRRS